MYMYMYMYVYIRPVGGLFSLCRTIGSVRDGVGRGEYCPVLSDQTRRDETGGDGEGKKTRDSGDVGFWRV